MSKKATSQNEECSPFANCIIPRNWKFIGTNNTRDNDEEGNETITVLGLVFHDTAKQVLIRLCYTLSSNRYIIVEKNAKGKYKTVCNFRSDEKEQLNKYISKHY